MKILFITKHFYPRIGGVEKQVFELSKRLINKGHKVTVLTERYEDILQYQETVDEVKIVRFNYPHFRYLGLLYIWLTLFLNSKLILSSDIIHLHGNFIWYWPFRILFFWKKAYTTFHGWEGVYPIPLKNKLIKKIDAFLSDGNITIHDYVEKYYGIKSDILSYTAIDLPKIVNFKKDTKRLVYVGRLDEDTGLKIILKALSKLKDFKVDFCGDGPLREESAQFGTVHGFTDPRSLLEKAFICLSPGVTSILEAFAYKSLVITAYNNPLKKDYLLMTPFKNWIIAEKEPDRLAEKIIYYSEHPESAKSKIDLSYKWVKTQSWENEIKRYYKLWNLKFS